MSYDYVDWTGTHTPTLADKPAGAPDTTTLIQDNEGIWVFKIPKPDSPRHCPVCGYDMVKTYDWTMGSYYSCPKHPTAPVHDERNLSDR